jgi:two-component system, OmpR family, sensor histidine kinase QseC
MHSAPCRLPRSLTARLLVLSVGSLLLVMTLIGAGVAAMMSQPVALMVRADLTNHVESLKEGMVFDAANRLVAVELPERLVQIYDGLGKDTAYRVMDAQGALLFASPPGPVLTALARRLVDITETDGSVVVDGIKLRVLTTSVQRHGQPYIFQVVRSERMAWLLMTNSSEITLTAGMSAITLGVIIFSLLVLWTSRRITRPLRDASAVASGITPRNLTARLDAQRLPSELTPLIDAFNSALERLEKGYQVQQDFLVSAAHELKTPLALIRAEIELSNPSGCGHLLTDVDLMARQVHQLLHLAEVSETHNYVFKTCDAAAVVSDAVVYLARAAQRSSVLVDHPWPLAPVPIQADGSALFILVKNLVENAIQHTSSSQTVAVRVNSDGLCVRNPGPRVAKEDQAKLFVRFWRAASSAHEGAGLGLSICEEIAVAHGWTLEVTDLPELPGTEFRVCFANTKT